MSMMDKISRRKSVRRYQPEPVDEVTLQKIKTFIATAKPLSPHIRVQAKIVSRDKVKSLMLWISPQVIAVYSEETEGSFENVGFLFQQVELYLQTLGLGACWIGLGKVEETCDDLPFVIFLAFGYPKGEGQRELAEFKRKPLAEIADWADERLEPARLAPSSVNNQPWYFVHDGDVIHTYCAKQGLIKTKTLGEMHLIDMGIALAHLYVANSETFRFFKVENAKERKGYTYVGSFTLL